MERISEVAAASPSVFGPASQTNTPISDESRKKCKCGVHFEHPTAVICATCAKKMFQDIPPKFRDQPAKWRNITLEHLADENALFIGEPGSGKSTQAAFLMRLRFSRGQPAKWISVPSLILRLQADYDHAYDALTTVITFDGLLVLDDFGGSKVTPFVHQCLYEIINHRESYLLLTLITSNYTLDQISDQIDDRISSRIAGMCNGGKNVRHFTGDKRIGT